MNDTLNIEKGTVLYKRSDGSEILFTRTNDEDFYASVRNPNGKVFEEQLLGSILRRGDWEATYEIVEKHGEHDQTSHGAWATGGAGVDISDSLRDVFYSGPRAEANKETQNKIDEMDRKDTTSGRGYADNALEIIAERQGFTGKPAKVETISDLQDFATKNDSFIVYRGISNFTTVQHDYDSEYTASDVTYSADQALKDFRDGDYHGGWGSFGNGTYVTSSVDTASSYANVVEFENGKLGNGKTMAIAIPYKALMPTKEVVKETMKSLHYGGTRSHKNDIGRALAAKGYQAYDVGHVQADKAGNWVVLDRSILTVAVQAVEDQ